MTTPSNGWSARLYWQWILYNTIAFVVVLTTVAVLSWIGADILQLSWANRSPVAALLVATTGAVLFGWVLGALQWQIVRQRVPVPRRKWIVANVGPALLGWLLVIIPAITTAQDSGTSVTGAYLLAASQTLALGPLLGAVPGVGPASPYPPLGRMDRCQHRLLGHRRRRVLAPFVLARHLRPHASRRLRRGGIPDAHRHHTPDRRMLLWVLAPAATTTEHQHP